MSTMETIPQERVVETLMTVGLMLKAQSAAAAQQVSPRMKKESLALEAKSAVYMVQLKVFA